MAILNLTALKKDCVALHASAFVYEGKGILVTGWAKGGKTESLLAFASQGAKYVGDEWILLRGEGNRMYGIPENIRLWNWHLEYLPEVRRQIGTEERALFRLIESLDGMQRLMVKGRLGNMVPVKFLRQAMPALNSTSPWSRGRSLAPVLARSPPGPKGYSFSSVTKIPGSACKQPTRWKSPGGWLPRSSTSSSPFSNTISLSSLPSRSEETPSSSAPPNSNTASCAARWPESSDTAFAIRTLCLFLNSTTPCGPIAKGVIASLPWSSRTPA